MASLRLPLPRLLLHLHRSAHFIDGNVCVCMRYSCSYNFTWTAYRPSASNSFNIIEDFARTSIAQEKKLKAIVLISKLCRAQMATIIDPMKSSAPSAKTNDECIPWSRRCATVRSRLNGSKWEWRWVKCARSHFWFPIEKFFAIENTFHQTTAPSPSAVWLTASHLCLFSSCDDVEGDEGDDDEMRKYLFQDKSDKL